MKAGFEDSQRAHRPAGTFDRMTCRDCEIERLRGENAELCEWLITLHNDWKNGKIYDGPFKAIDFLIAKPKEELTARKQLEAANAAAAVSAQLAANRVERLETELAAAGKLVNLSNAMWRDAEADNAELVEALERLAKLGNGDRWGNSEGNLIAQTALAKHKATDNIVDGIARDKSYFDTERNR